MPYDRGSDRPAESAADESAGAGRVPAAQRPYEVALEAGLAALLSSAPPDPQLEALGARREGQTVVVPVLGGRLIVDPQARDVFVEGGGPAKRAWAILALHYLSAGDVPHIDKEVTFGTFSDCRSYLKVFEKRIIGRFLATAGRTPEQFNEMAGRLGGVRLPGPGIRYRFGILPRVPITIVRYDGDEEIGPGASVVYRGDVEFLLPPEDRVVAVELLLDALTGKGLEEPPGGTR